MEPVWNGLLTCDYEHTRPDASRLEWDLYTSSLTAWPANLMDDPAPYGRLRRPGIVDIPEPDHARLLAAWHTRLADPAYTSQLITTARRRQRRTSLALDRVDHALAVGDTAAATEALAEATTVFVAVMSTHIVNWLLPEEQWEALLARLLGSRAAAGACLLSLMTPTAAGHLLTRTHQAASTSDADIAHLPATALAMPPGTPPTAPDATAGGINAAAEATPPGVADARQDAIARRDAWAAAAVLAAAGDRETLTAVRAMTPICRWAADSEERRKELRDRYLTAAQAWCAHTGADPARLTTADPTAAGAHR